MSRLHDLFLDCKGLGIAALETTAADLAFHQRGVNWWIGDVAVAAEAISEKALHQVFPEWMSPDLISRCKAVAKAYPRDEDRNPLASWTIHMREAGRPDRIQRVQAHIDAGRTSDEARQANQQELAKSDRPRWLLAFDVHYYAHRHYFSGAGVETAMQVAEWINRTVERLKEKGATDVLCAFEGRGSFRKELTAGEAWIEHRYKDRPQKPDDLKHQLQLVRDLIEGQGLCCISMDGYEADDVLASAAAQFPGKTTVVTADKDLRQALSDTTNILLDVTWAPDETSGEMMPDYKWLTATAHTEATGIRPDQWAEFQIIMGDNVDGIQGVAGIGEKGAADLIKQFGSVAECIRAAKADDPRIKAKKREALIEFEGRHDITRKLVTLRTDLPIPTTTRI
jgi:5'-3' exonuclease